MENNFSFILLMLLSQNHTEW